MHPLLANAENDTRRRTPGPFARDRKLTALERQRAKLVAILAIHGCQRLAEPDCERGSRPSMR